MLYLYAITEERPLPHVSGMQGAPLRAIRSGGIAAVASEHRELRPVAEADHLWTHESVVEALMERGAVLPMRFGTVLAGAEDVVSFLRVRAAELQRALDRVRGAVEIGVRLAIADEPGAAPGPDAGDDVRPGTSYMLDRLSAERRSAEVAGRVASTLAPLARDHVAVAGPRRRASLSSAYLVERSHVEDFTGRVASLEDELDGVAVACTGPWPPYSFTTGVA